MYNIGVLIGSVTLIISARHVPLSHDQVLRLKQWTKEDQNMWQLSGQLEGDMVLDEFQERSLHARSRNGITYEQYHWPNKTLVYSFLNGSCSLAQRTSILAALAYFDMLTCVQIRTKTPADVNYVNVTCEDEGCFALIGHQGGAQRLNLQYPGCFEVGTILHEFLHAFGFYHMHSDPSRDSYVNVSWDNIKTEQISQFNKYTTGISSFGYQYDYSSVMHYDNFAFSKNNLPTLKTTNPAGSFIGQRYGFSATDIAKLSKMYGCTVSSG